MNFARAGNEAAADVSPLATGSCDVLESNQPAAEEGKDLSLPFSHALSGLRPHRSLLTCTIRETFSSNWINNRAAVSLSMAALNSNLDAFLRFSELAI